MKSGQRDQQNTLPARPNITARVLWITRGASSNGGASEATVRVQDAPARPHGADADPAARGVGAKPDQRLGQLVGNAARRPVVGDPRGRYRDPFDVEDDEMWRGLERMARGTATGAEDVD